MLYLLDIIFTIINLLRINGVMLCCRNTYIFLHSTHVCGSHSGLPRLLLLLLFLFLFIVTRTVRSSNGREKLSVTGT